MELNEMKSVWKAANGAPKAPEEIEIMLRENRHPVLKGIRKQTAIELTGWSAFLLVYYSMFDGDSKPLLINLTPVTALMLSISLHLYSYHLNKQLIHGPDLFTSLSIYFSKIKSYAVYTIMTRALLMAGLLIFFTYGIHFTTAKYWGLAVICLIFLVQLCLLYILWKKRLNHLRRTLTAFAS